MYMCVYVYIYIYTHIYWEAADDEKVKAFEQEIKTLKARGKRLRPISLLTLSLLKLLDSNFLGNSLWASEFHPLTLRLRLSQTL